MLDSNLNCLCKPGYNYNASNICVLGCKDYERSINSSCVACAFEKHYNVSNICVNDCLPDERLDS